MNEIILMLFVMLLFLVGVTTHGVSDRRKDSEHFWIGSDSASKHSVSHLPRNTESFGVGSPEKGRERTGEKPQKIRHCRDCLPYGPGDKHHVFRRKPPRVGSIQSCSLRKTSMTRTAQ